MTAQIIHFAQAQLWRDLRHNTMRPVGYYINAVIRSLIENDPTWNRGVAILYLYERKICATMAEAAARVDEIMR